MLLLQELSKVNNGQVFQSYSSGKEWQEYIAQLQVFVISFEYTRFIGAQIMKQTTSKFELTGFKSLQNTE